MNDSTLFARQRRAHRRRRDDRFDVSDCDIKRRPRPLVFTEHGALVAATLLNSTRAVEVSLYVVRAFVRVNAVANATLNSGMASDVTERSII